MRSFIYFLIFFFFFNTVFSQEIWRRDILGKRPSEIVTDQAGNVYIAGTIDYGVSPQSLTDFYVAKISSNGDSLWAHAINGTIDNAEDDAYCVAVDANGNVYAGGYNHNEGGWWKRNYLLVKFDQNGNEQWRYIYNGSNDHLDEIKDILIDDSGNIYISGFSTETINTSSNRNVTTAKFSANGDSLWLHSWNSPISSSDEFEAMYLHNNELVIVGETVVSSFPWDVYAPFIIKYDVNGNVLFDSLYNDGSNNDLWGSAFDASGNIYTLAEHNSKIEITKYDSNLNNLLQFQFLPDSTNWSITNKIQKPIVVDNQGNITIMLYVQIGQSWPWVYEIIIAQFDAYGTMNWMKRHETNSTDDDPLVLKTDNMGYIYAVSQLRAEVEPFVYVDYTVINKYDHNGNIIWGVADDTLHNGSGGSNRQVADLVPHDDGTFHVTYSARKPQSGNTDFLRTINYDTQIPSGLDSKNNLIPDSPILKQNFPNPFNPVTNIEFDILSNDFVTLVIFNSVGQKVKTLVNQNLSAGNYKYTWDASRFASGIYYYKLLTGSGFSQTKKLVLIK